MIDEGSLSLALIKQIDFAWEHFLLSMAHITFLNHFLCTIDVNGAMLSASSHVTPQI